MVTETAPEIGYAKINLALHVRRRREDGYHELETLFAFVDAGDRLRVEPADTLSLDVTGPFAGELQPDDDNLVLRAARALHDAYDRDGAVSRDWQARLGLPYGAKITLEKNLPIASGIGGGSADAAAAIRLLTALWDLPDDYGRHLSIAAGLGADVPACVASQACIGTGTGIDLDLADNDLAGTPVLLVNPLVPLSTGPVFKAWDGVDRGALPEGLASKIAREGRNDLEAPAIALCPVIAEVLAALANTNPWLARMSGSGATCFALYDTPEARDAAKAAMPQDWWTMAGRLR
jgi:4-diphosphocytidyl-2-C-methyl-D-erythritol kinase